MSTTHLDAAQTSTTGTGPDHQAGGVRARLAAYDAAQRSRATDRGAVVLRMAQSAAPRRASTAQDGATTLFVFLRGGELACQQLGRSVQAATPDRLAGALLNPGQVLAPVNPAAATRIEALLRPARGDGSVRSEEQDRREQAVRLLRYARNAVVSSKYLVLTDALARKFYSPTTVHPGSLRGWATCLGVRVPTDGPVAGFAALLAQVWSAEEHLTVSFGGRTGEPYQAILKSEANVDEAAARAGAGSAATQYAAAVAVAEAWSTLCRVDPILRARAETAGEATRIRVIRQDRSRFLAAPTGAVRVKEGRCIVSRAEPTAGRVEFVDLESFRVDDDQLRVVLNRDPKASTRNAGASTALLLESLHERIDLLLSPAPYLQPSRRIVARQWSGRQVRSEDRITRDVPLHVMLAGA